MRVKPLAEIEEFLRPIAAETGVEILEVAWNARGRALAVFIDAPGGVDLVLCERFHRAIDAPLDELDPTFGEPYTLNCSSPGLDRPFRKQADFDRHLGEAVEVHLYAPYEGAKYYEGELLAFDGETVVLRTEQGEKRIPFAKCSKVCLLIEV